MVNKEIPLVGAYSIHDNTVVFSTPPNEGDLVELTRDTQLDRETNFKSYDNSFRPETINFDLDKIWLVLQEANLVDAKILARLKQEIEWRRIHDFNYDELAQVREKQLFDALKSYTDTLNAATNPGVFQGVVAGVVFAQDGKSIQTHLEEILETLAQERENIDSKADQTYVEEQLDLKANQDTTYSKTEVDSALDQKASKVDIYTKPEVDTALSAIAGGHKAYQTLALAQAAQASLPANTVVEVTNDPTASNNGTYQWNGTTLTKSAYDPLTQAKEDATTKANAAEANAKSYAEQIDKKIDYYQTENLLNPNQETAVGYYVNGVPGGQAGSVSALEYYPVTAGQKLWVRGASGSTVVPIYAADKTFIGNLNYNDAVSGVLTVAESYGSKTPAFVRFSLFGNTSLENFSFGYGDLRPPLKLAYQEKYSTVNNKNFSSAIAEDIISSDSILLKQASDALCFDLYNDHLVLFKNLVNPNQEVIQGFYSNSGITTPFLSLPNYYVTTEFIPVPPNRKFWILGAGSGNLLQLCDINKNPISALNLSVVTNNRYTVPATAGTANKEVHYIRVGSSLGEAHIRNNGLGVGWANDALDVPAKIPAYGSSSSQLSTLLMEDISERMGVVNSPLFGKKWAAMGDSITTTSYSAGVNYAIILSNKHGSALTLYSKGGARVHREPESTFYILSEEYLNIPTANPPDLITIAGGTNDSVATERLGVFSDRVNTTFYGALHVLLAGLRNRFPNARIGFIAPIPRTTRYIEGDTSNTPYLKWKAIKEVCAYYSVPCWNGNTEFGASPSDSTTWKDAYMPDGLHPSDVGHVWYANRVENFILSLAK